MTDETRLPPVESNKDFGKPPTGIVKRWLAEIDLYERQFKKYYDRCDHIVKRYRDERDFKRTSKKMNILWSNIETLKPAVYAKAPNPDVQRRFKDKDPVGKAAAEVLERTLAYHIDCYDFDQTLRMCRDDYLLTARGQSWVRYDPLISQGQSQGAAGQDYEEVVSEHIACDYVYRDDFGHTPGRTWDEVDAVWRKVYLTREKLVSRFGDKIGNAVQLDTKPEAMSKEEANKHGEVFKTACVYEIWDKRDRKAYWIARGYPGGALDIKDDPLRLERFFPCPRPLYGNLTTDQLVPLPDFAQYQDQANEIDDLTDRITSLTKALKAAGWYAADEKQNIGQVRDAKDGDLIPVTNWAMFAEKGMDKLIAWYPVEQVAQVVEQLYAIRTQLKQDLLEVTGLSDIVRGQGDANETATAQKIKGQFASMRLKDRQGEMARFARDLLRLKAEIIAEQFAPETLQMMSGLEFPMTEQERMAPMLQWQQAAQQAQMTGQQPPPQPEIKEASWEAIITLLRDDRLRSYRIDIETDSTIALDEQLEKEQAAELLGAVTPYLSGMVEAMQVAPPLLELQGQMLQATIRRYKMGRSLEETFERTIEQLKQIASQPRPDPEQQKLQAEQQTAQQKMQLDQAKAQQDAQIKQQEAASTLQLEQQKAAAALQLEQVKLQHQMALEEKRLGFEMQKAEMQMGIENQKMQMQSELDREKAATDSELKREELGQNYDFRMIELENEAEAEAMKNGGEVKRSFKGPVQRLGEVGTQQAESMGRIEQALANQSQALTQMAEAVSQLAQAVQMQAMTPRTISVTRDASGRLVGGMSQPVGNA